MNLRKITNFIVLLGILSTGIAGLFFNVFPVLSSTLLIFGIAVGIIVNVRTEAQLSNNEQHDKIVAKMMSMQGLGNPYTKEYFYNMYNIPKAKNPEQIKKAFEIDPNDADTVSLYCTHKALELSFCEWQGKNNEARFKKELSSLKRLINKKMALFPENPFLSSALGIVLDINEEHYLAREAFKKAGVLGGDPFWRISVCTSFLKEGLYDEALEELEKAKNGGMNHINIHFGKVFQAKGDYKESEKYYRKALKHDSRAKGVMRTTAWKAQVLTGISFNLYFQGAFIHSLLLRIKLGLYLLCKMAFMRGIVEILEALVKIIIRMVFLISKLLIPLYTKFPPSQVIARRLPPDSFEDLIGTHLLVEEKHFKAAGNLLKKALEINKKLNWPLPIAINSLHLGTCYLAQNVFVKKTENLFLESLRIFNELDDIEGTAKAHSMLSEFYRINNNKVKQKEHENKSLKCFHGIGLNEEDIRKEYHIIEIEEDREN